MDQEGLLIHLHRSLRRVLCHPPPRRGGQVHKISLAQHNLQVPHGDVWTQTKHPRIHKTYGGCDRLPVMTAWDPHHHLH